MPRKILSRYSRSTQTSRSTKARSRRVRAQASPKRRPKVSASTSGLTIKARPSTLEERFSIPEAYGQDQVVLIARDPRCLFAYWEIQPKTERTAQSQLLPQEVPGLQTVLRVYSIRNPGSRSEESRRLQDIGFSGLAKNWYISVPEAGSFYRVEIGILTAAGRFVPMAMSNVTATPPAVASENLDPEWAPDPQLFDKFISELSFSSPGSSSTAAFSSHTRLPEAISVTPLKEARAFSCHVETDLVIYGTTEPRARVFVQGQPIPVRRDGSFSLRIALPEGTRTIHVEAISADGKHTVEVAPVIMRTAVVTGDETPSHGRVFMKHDKGMALE